MSFEDEVKGDYVHALVSLDGFPKPIHCWAAVYVAPGGQVYMGNVQLDFRGLKDPETGVRPVLRRDLMPEDEKTLRAALEKELKEFLES